MLRDPWSRSDDLRIGTREYERRCDHRIIIVAEGVLKVILYITKY